MKLLADANIEGFIVAWLRREGPDVLWGVELAPGCPDEQLLDRAVADARILLTNDLDFGDLVFRRGLAVGGVLLLRLRSTSPVEHLSLFRKHWEALNGRLNGCFVVAKNDRARVRPLLTTAGP